MSYAPKKTAVATRRYQQVLAAIDRIAMKNALAFLTTQRVSRESGVSDGVLFRHFANREAMLTAWVESRNKQLNTLLAGMPAGRNGFLYTIQRLLDDDALLSFICCQTMDVPHLRQQMAHIRMDVQQQFQARIACLHDRPAMVSAAILGDHLMVSLYRAWNPENPRRKEQKEQFMDGLPWEKSSATAELFPAYEALQQLALNDSGFVFDPVNGRSFTANAIGLFLLRLLQKQYDMPALLTAVSEAFDVDAQTAARDITEFAGQLRKLLA